MKLKTGNMWDTSATIYLATCNNYITNAGRLVMGRGAAKEMKTRWPNVDKILGSIILRHKKVSENPYGLAITQIDGQSVGVFQVKNHWYNPAELDLIRYSTEMLCVYLDLGKVSVSLNFPGIGNGQLDRKDVEPIIKKLPDCVTVWTKE